jgi:hypothetical protein
LFTGAIIKISDVGPAGSYWISNGTRWQPLGGSCVIAVSHVAVSVTGTTSETNLAMIGLPSNLMSANGQLEIFLLWSHTNNANTKAPRVRFGFDYDALSGNIYYNPSISTSNTTQSFLIIKNNNAQNIQYGFANNTGLGYTTSTNAVVTSNWNTASTVYNTGVAINGALTNAADTLTLEGYSITYVEG